MSDKADENRELENYPEYEEKTIQLSVAPGQNPTRLDQYLTNMIQNASRNRIQKAIEVGNVLVNGKEAKRSRRIQPGDEIYVKLLTPPPIELIPEDIGLNIVYEDEWLMIVNKPPGMVTHPGFGNRHGTLVNAVLWHLGERESITLDGSEDEDDLGDFFKAESMKPGIIHRLDKNTSGLLVIAKEPQIQLKIAEQFEQRTVEKMYYALVWGKFEQDHGVITGDIGRSPRDRKLYAVVNKGGKPSMTEYFVEKRLHYVTLVRIKLHTGRTHQIRVHFKHIDRPIFGDPEYGGGAVVYGGYNTQWKSLCEKSLKKTNRQMLHAGVLGFEHPVKKEFMRFQSDIPKDMQRIINMLSEDIRYF